ncbi:uncharacterized protein [Lolium perenne]|uniref:uncharacterized protein n=1 Tax=Lolium perenne TaxID=4522 RepID=UPI003A9A3360
MRRFVASWFDEFDWLEYSVEKYAVFCFPCFLFKDQSAAGGDSFVNGGFRNWNMRRRLEKHVGQITSSHNNAQEKYNYFTQPKKSIEVVLAGNTKEYKALYASRLTYSLKCLRFLLQQGLAFRGHDESEDSLNRGNFLELLKWLANTFSEVDKVVLNNAPQKCKMIDPKIQKQLIASCAKESTKLMLEDLDGDYFTILADESSDVRQIEQLALCIRYVDKKGRVVERFLGIVEVEDTTSLTLKKAIVALLMDHSLSFSMVRGQGYDGVSNMKGHVNGLKKLIMDESPSAYYIHCFAHQLQLTLVAVAKQCGDCGWFFQQLGYLLNVLGMSCKKIRMLRLAQADRIIEALHLGEIESGQGLNQEMGLARPCDTRWNSHYKTVSHVMAMYPSIRTVFIKIGKEYSGMEAIAAQTMLTSFEYAIC